MEDLKINQSRVNISFHSQLNNDKIGEFFEDNGVLKFDGKLDESGVLFVNFICETFNKRIDDLVNEKLNQ